MKNIELLVQDDCDPDAMDIFRSKFIDITNVTLAQFKDRAIFVDDFTLTWTLEDYQLQISPDDPYYRLSIRTSNTQY